MQRTRKQWKEIIPYRLDDVYEGVIRKDEPPVIRNNLRSFNLASEHYDFTCLAVDVWHLFDRKPPKPRPSVENLVIRDPLFRIFFGVVIRSMQDIRLGRPCDDNSWHVDIPPGSVEGRCTPTIHVCRDSAYEFIAETGSLWEAVLNLPYGTLVEMITKENGFKRSRSRKILSYIGQ